MGKINTGRWILCGVIAGIVGDLIGSLVDGVLLAPQWNTAFTRLRLAPMNGTEVVEFNIVGILIGLAAMWIYVAIRPRFGPGAKTAVYAGFVTWFLCILLPDITFMYIPHAYPHHLLLYTTAGNLIGCVLATIVGAALYRET
jgi:uncharacterized membrane protein